MRLRTVETTNWQMTNNRDRIVFQIALWYNNVVYIYGCVRLCVHACVSLWVWRSTEVGIQLSCPKGRFLPYSVFLVRQTDIIQSRMHWENQIRVCIVHNVYRTATKTFSCSGYLLNCWVGRSPRASLGRRMTHWWQPQQLWPLTRYIKLLVAHAPGMPWTFFPSPTSKETAI